MHSFDFRFQAAGVALLGLLLTGAAPAGDRPTLDDAKAFMDQAEKRLLELAIRRERAQWVASTFITDDTETIAAQANKELIAANMELAAAARRFEGLELPADLARKFKLLKLSLTLPAPGDPQQQTELTTIVAALEGMYGKGRYCPQGQECRDLEQLSRVLAESRDYDELLDAWRGWRTIAPPMRPKYTRFVELANAGARDLGFADLGALWRSGYDMPPDAFAAEMERLWQQVRPLYVALHAHVRASLREAYGARRVPASGPIPAHLLGNMWSQSWENVYPLVAPKGADRGFDVSQLLKARNVDALGMVRYGEAFFTSLGLEPLPKSFWERSLFVKPRDRDVVCHASAWDIDWVSDLRIKMCIQPTEEDFVTIHHELGHNFYQRAYSPQPFLFANSAHDGFHEAIGDTIALSVTPGYLVKVGLLDKEPPPGRDLGLLMAKALERVAFMPFGFILDQWRWKVFSGEIQPGDYNAAWWRLVREYQGVESPVARSEADFDPGAKYHIPANTPYSRYFLAAVLQFQVQRGLCRAAGYEGPLHLCSVYGNAAAGAKLRRFLEMGQSRPWQDALYELTGERQMDAGAMLEYFAPLSAWLEQQNKGRPVGWSAR